MNDKKYTNRKVDKMKLEKSKQHLWRYIQAKANQDEQAEQSAWETLKSWLLMPRHLIPALSSVVAVLVIVSLVFTTNFSGWFNGDGVLKVNTVHASFAMSAEDEDSSGVAADSSFKIKASEDISEKDLEASLSVSPELEIKVEKVGDKEFKLTPVKGLEANKVYNFSIKTDAGEVSWAYQVRDTFKIMGTLPGDKSGDVPTNSGIEFNFSHESYDFAEFEDLFEISPKVKGDFEQHRRTAVFAPSEALEPGTIYTVTLKGGLSLKDSEQEIADDYVFQFETGEKEQVSNGHFSFTKDYYEAAVGTAIGLKAYTYSLEDAGIKNLELSVYQYPSLNLFLASIAKKHSIPDWAYYSSNAYRYDSTKLKKIGSFEADVAKYDWSGYVYVPNLDLEAGYYLVEVDDENYFDQALVQVTDLSSYVSVTLTDSLVWVNDIKTGKPVEGAEVKLEGSENSYKTDSKGTVSFETPEEWKKIYAVTGDEKLQSYLQITKGEKVLVNPIEAYSYWGSKSSYWSLFDTDRPMYKPTDSLKFWGFIESKNSNDLGDLKVKIEYGWNTFVSETPVKIDDNGTFIGEIQLKNFTPGYYNLYLFEGENEVASSYFEVSNYIKPAYNLSVEADKNAVFSGEKVNFNIKANFFDGTPTPDLDVEYYTAESGSVTKATDSNGEINSSFVAEYKSCENGPEYCYNSSTLYLDASANLAEETSIWSSDSVRVFNSKLELTSKGEFKESNGQININANWIDLSKLNGEEAAPYYDYLGKAAANKKVSGKIVEYYWDKYESGDYYDFINKITQKNYDYKLVENDLESFEVLTNEKGEAGYSFPVKEGRNYKAFLQVADDEGKTSYETVYIYGSSYTGYGEYYSVKIKGGQEHKNDWGDVSNLFSIGDEVTAYISNNDDAANGAQAMETSEGDSFLFMQQANGLQEYAVLGVPIYKFKFGKEDVPNVNVAGVWFDGENYKVAWGSSADYDKDLERLNIDIETDEESYEPGDEVTLKVHVSDSDGDDVGAAVNLNLVDEAYYKIVYDYLSDPLDSLLVSNGDGVLLALETHDNPLSVAEDMGGKGGCFTAETRILMADGSYKMIKDIHAGDMVMTKKREYSSELVPARVTDTVSHFVSEYLLINDDLEVTGVHIVFVNGHWDTADSVKIGDYMLGKNGEEIKVASIRKVVEPVWVYNFEVENYHTYFANDYYVHNDKGGDSMARSDFEDTALFTMVETDSNGNGEISFELPDNITSWRIVASAVDTENKKAGYGIGAVNVSLPAFADVIVNREYSVKDEPMIKFRTYGSALKAGDKVEYTVEAPSLGLDKSEVIAGEAFKGSYYDLGKLNYGKHKITLNMNAGKFSDSILKTINVVGSRLSKNVTEHVEKVESGKALKIDDKAPTMIRLVDAGLGKHFYELWGQLYLNGERLEQRLSRIVAAEMLNEYFNAAVDVYSEDLANTYQADTGGLSLLPYSDQDLQLTAMVLYLDGAERFDQYALKNYLYAIYQNQESNLEEVVLALLGLAGMGEPVLISLREIQNEESLSLEEKLYIALAFEALGSQQEAKNIYDEVFSQLSADKSKVTPAALGAILAGSFADEKAADLLWQFVDLGSNNTKNGDEDFYGILYRIAYTKKALKNVVPEFAKFKLTVGDHVEEVELGPWNSFEIMALPGDKVVVDVEEGIVGATMQYSKDVEIGEIKVDNSVKINRVYSVDGKVTDQFKEGDLVKVELNLDYLGSSKFDSFSVVDTLASGLTPVTSPLGLSIAYDRYYPYRIDGQSVYFYWSYSQYYDYGKRLYYYARVVNPGQYYAEPAVIQSFSNESVINISEGDFLKISASIN